MEEKKKGPNFTTASAISLALRKIDSLKDMEITKLRKTKEELDELVKQFNLAYKSRKNEIKKYYEEELRKLNDED